MIGEKLWNIKREIAEHFKESHGRSPKPDPYGLIFGRDFEGNLVDLESDDFRPFTFTSRLFRSDDYCVAVITWNNYYHCQTMLSLRKSPEETQKSLRLTLYPYFL